MARTAEEQPAAVPPVPAGETRKRERPEEPAEPSPRRVTFSDPPGGGPSPEPRTREEAELSEESVRAFIASLGGRVTVAVLKESFKAAVAQYNKTHRAPGDDKPGGRLLLEVVKRLTVTEEDPVMGKVLRLAP